MRSPIIGIFAGGAWLAVSFFIENLFPLGDWRWLIAALLFVAAAGVAWWWPKRGRQTHTEDDEIPLRKDVIDRDAGVVWTKDKRGYPIAATSIEDMKGGKLAPSPSPTPPAEKAEPCSTDMIPLLDAIEWVWGEHRRGIRRMVGTEYEGSGVHRMLFNMMFDGQENSVPLFGAKPPLRTLDIIKDAYDYDVSEDCTEAVCTWDEKKRITNLQVRRNDIKLWVKRFDRK